MIVFRSCTEFNNELTGYKYLLVESEMVCTKLSIHHGCDELLFRKYDTERGWPCLVPANDATKIFQGVTNPVVTKVIIIRRK